MFSYDTHHSLAGFLPHTSGFSLYIHSPLLFSQLAVVLLLRARSKSDVTIASLVASCFILSVFGCRPANQDALPVMMSWCSSGSEVRCMFIHQFLSTAAGFCCAYYHKAKGNCLQLPEDGCWSPHAASAFILSRSEGGLQFIKWGNSIFGLASNSLDPIIAVTLSRNPRFLCNLKFL